MPLPGAASAVPTLRRLGIKFAFVTNNATLTPALFEEKLRRVGVEANGGDVVTSPQATAAYLARVAPSGASAFVIGEQGLVQAVEGAGLRVDDVNPTYVVVGLDRHVTYERLARACIAIQRGAELIATNADPAIPVEEGYWPGAGAILACIVTATGAAPTIIGKPKPTLLQVALERIGVHPSQAAMVGDQIGTDILAGHAAGMRTILVESPIPQPDADVQPDLRVRDLAELLELLEHEYAEERLTPLPADASEPDSQPR